MAQPARARPAAPTASPWPISPAARDALAAEVERLAADVAHATGGAVRRRPAAGGAPGRVASDRPVEGGAEIVRLPDRGGRERLTVLRELLEAASVVADPSVVAIGRRATLREESGATWTCALVAPGDGDAEHGWVSAGSPLGAALLGRRAGDTAEVDAPGGRWTVAVERVEEPTMLDGCPPAPAAPTSPPSPRRQPVAWRP